MVQRILLLQFSLLIWFRKLTKFWAGCHQDHRQVPAGPCEPGQGIQGGRGDEAGEPSQHREALPGDGDQEHALPGVRICSQRRNIW